MNELTYTERLRYWQRTDLSNRIQNVLVMQGIDSIEELLKLDKFTLLRMPNFGNRSMRELQEWIDYNFHSKAKAEQLSDFTDEQLLREIARRMRKE